MRLHVPSTRTRQGHIARSPTLSGQGAQDIVVRQQLLGKSIDSTSFQAPGAALDKVGLHHLPMPCGWSLSRRDKVDTLTPAYYCPSLTFGRSYVDTHP
jgi:hypothetical protein